MTDTEQKLAAKKFAERWKGKGYEKGESQPFWLSLLRDVYGVEHPEDYITFEEQVHLDHTSFIDGMIPATRVMIEQKGLGKNLNKAIRQSNGALFTPFQQAKNYILELPVDEHPRWVITCNFAEFWIYDMNKPGGEPEKILFENLEKEYYRLQFLVNIGSGVPDREMELSIAAGEIVGLIYDAFAAQYGNSMGEYEMHSLNVLCVRLVFCLYAENAGLFGRHTMFHDYLAAFDTQHMRRALEELFHILDTPVENRSRHLADDEPLLAEFPYVNGGLFSEEDVDIPRFTDEIRDLLLNRASAGFDWSDISPTIFGAVFESTLNPETRRSGGMHYTSIENIHKVIDPLFLDDLKKEFEEIKNISVAKTREQKLRDFQKKLGMTNYLDPACGSGNFLTESYLSLRRLENDVLRELAHGQIAFGDELQNPIQVSIGQFYGIEINDFAVTVAKTALWIAESQMLKETEEIVLMHLDFLPLKSYTNIIEGNALRLDWESVVPKEKLNFIMGNPPFSGARLMNAAQKSDVADVFAGWKNVGNLDYVSCWYKKAADFMRKTTIRTALVSTNSISQGESVATLWQPLMDSGVHIDFAHRTFRWDSEAKIKAHVHCVIIGFSIAESGKPKVIYDDGRPQIAQNINGYLLDAENIFVASRKTPICNVPEIVFGNMPNDGGYLSNFSTEEKDKIISAYPQAEPMFRRFVGATEFLHGQKRWCLWLQGVSPAVINSVPPVKEAVSKVQQMRAESTRSATRKLAETPMLFGEIRQPDSEYIMIPRHSSEKRHYIPMGFVEADVICGDSNFLFPNASLYDFGILTSNIHNAWIRAVCGRIKSDYRYSKDVVYNNFPWPSPTDAQRQKIEQTAKEILDARNIYPDCSLSDLYDDVIMPPELRKAHQANDLAVMAAYGFPVAGFTESACVAELMKMYCNLCANSV